MKFDEKYPAVNARKLFPDKLMGPHREIAVSTELVQSWRMYPCGACNTPTGWRLVHTDSPGVPACSEECFAELKKDAEEACAAPPAMAS